MNFLDNPFFVTTIGTGIINIKTLEPTEVTVGDVIVIPEGISQRIKNVGNCDLVFYCICTPRFTQEQYINDETTDT
ncbi:MAG: hypothetical protein LBU83_03310 [Bacteroidales bacterium]|nr:hypothetical protein [Bacteroidales bacterium]